MKRNFVIVGSVVVVIGVLAGLFVWQTQSASAATKAPAAQTATVQRGSITATISAAGNVSSPEAVSLVFQQSGTVSQVNVNVGDKVTQGQTLMQLDSTDLNLALKNAQANLASAQANYNQTQADLQYALRTAQASFDSAQANLVAAQAKNGQNANQLVVAKAALDKAQSALQVAQAAYDKIGGSSNPMIGMTTQSQNLANATSDYQSALANYNITVATTNDAALQQAQAQADTAQIALDQAKSNLDTKLATAQAQLTSAQVAVDQAQRNLDKTKLVAPFDGIVSAVNYGVGDSASGAAASLVNLSNLQVKVTIAEIDLPRLKVGNSAQITLDALPGKTYTATVAAISPAGTITQGVVNYPVILTVTNADSAIKPGMTANVSVVVDQRSNVLVVPLRAVHAQGNQKTVTVQVNGQTVQQTVTTGLSNDQSVEITKGLQPGDVVVLNQTQTRQPNVGGGIGIPGLGGRLGGG
ncbi:MAG: efflux RND transporter periplasmic adaptor subunit [Chloroflexota bacterium]|nr:efflux RND transporter periplasmic adaptor subunit [Chloroflexota bacterium]